MGMDGKHFGLTIAGHENWKHAGWMTRIAAWAFGRHEVFDHLGWTVHLTWWQGMPYLVSLREPA